MTSTLVLLLCGSCGNESVFTAAAEGSKALIVSGLEVICLQGILLNVTRDHRLESSERVDSKKHGYFKSSKVAKTRRTHPNTVLLITPRD